MENMKTDAALQPLLLNASRHFQNKQQHDVAALLELLSKAAKLRRLNREEIEKISLIFAPKGPWETTAGQPELSTALARLLSDH